MIDSTQRIRLDLCDNQVYEQIYTKQYNEGYPIEFEITKDGNPVDLFGIVAVFELKKPDNTIVTEYCTISDNIVSVNLTNQMTVADGKAKFQVVLFDQATYNPDDRTSAVIIATVTGIMKIDKSTVQNGDIESSSVFNLVTEVLIEIENAKVASQKAQEYMNNSLTYSNNSKASAIESATSASAAKTSETNAKTSENNAKTYASNAKTSETNAASSASSASNSASSASVSATTATTKASEASEYASQAYSSMQYAASSARSSSEYSLTSKEFAIGSTNSAKYYYEQAKTISESFSGALRPMGTVTFANLPSLSTATAGDMYNISDEFTTTSDFKEGSGSVISSGSNVYKTSDGKWDILAGTPVVGVKGANESTYRRGNINITANDVGFEIISITEPSNQEIGCYWLVDY